MLNPRNTLLDVFVKSAVRTLGGNGQDLVENAIDVVFDPIIEFSEFIDDLFGW